MESSEVRKRLRRYFPIWKPANIILTDTYYEDITVDELQSEIVNVSTKGDCDDYARELEYFIRHNHYQWPVGRAILNKVSGKKTNHTMVVSVCIDEVYLIEPQIIFDIGLAGMEKIRKANVMKDKFYFTYI